MNLMMGINPLSHESQESFSPWALIPQATNNYTLDLGKSNKGLIPFLKYFYEWISSQFFGAKGTMMGMNPLKYIFGSKGSLPFL